jgi:hypothetical protein
MTAAKRPAWQLAIIVIWFAALTGAAGLAFVLWRDFAGDGPGATSDRIVFGLPLPLVVILGTGAIAAWVKGHVRTAWLLSLLPVPVLYGLIALANGVSNA